MKGSGADSLIVKRNELRQKIDDGKSNNEEELNMIEVKMQILLKKKKLIKHSFLGSFVMNLIQ